MNIVHPAVGSALVEGEHTFLLVDANDDAGIALVEFRIDGTLVATATTAPYRYDFVAPAGVAQLTFDAAASDLEGNRGVAPTVQVQLIPDPLTTVTGRVVDGAGAPVAGAAVEIAGLPAYAGSSDGAGQFSLAGVPTVNSLLRVHARANVGGVTLKGTSAFTVPVRGGVTNVGAIVVRDVVRWDGGGDGTAWHDPRNWSQDLPPGPLDDVLIDLANANPTVVFSQGEVAIHSLVSNEALLLTGGALEVSSTVQVNNTFRLQGGTLAHANVLPGSGGQALEVTTAGGVLDGVTMNANLDLAFGSQNAAAAVRNGLTLNGVANLGTTGQCNFGRLDFEGSQTLSGTGAVVFADRLKLRPATIPTTTGCAWSRLARPSPLARG